jgi:hypothetical protein
MKGKRQFDDTEVGAEMAAGDRDLFQDEPPDLLGQLLELVVTQRAKISRLGDLR